jgi:ribosome-associated protein
MSDQDRLETIIRENCSFSFSRSSGKGGQNVNKVNTKVLALLPLSSLTLYSPEEIEKLKAKLKKKLTKTGELMIQVQDDRTQIRNRELAVSRLAALIRTAVKPVKKRRKTKPSRGAREQRLSSKKKQTAKKQRRSSTHFE